MLKYNLLNKWRGIMLNIQIDNPDLEANIKHVNGDNPQSIAQALSISSVFKSIRATNAYE